MKEREFLEQLFRQHYRKMVSLARSILRNDVEADDVVQDVFARLSEMEFQIEDGKVEAYLMSSVRYGCFRRIKEMQLREQVAKLHLFDEIEDMTDDELQMQLDLIREFVDKRLPEPQKSAFNLRIDEGLTFKEIAERLNTNINTVYKHFIQCLEQIKLQFPKK